jgi:[protein-PII] uridylyltransferase
MSVGLRAALGRVDATLAAELERGNDGLDLARMRSRLLDDVLREHFAESCARVKLSTERAPIVLAAAGSYGRSAMGLRSDVDVRLLAVGRASDARALSDALLYPLWDAGLAVGHQLAVPGEMLALAKDDLATATSLVDLRTIAGDPRPVRELVSKFLSRARGRAADFARSLAEDTKKRHERYGDSVYLLEPDVKLGSGGLRDLEVARWMLAALASGEGDPLDLLVTSGALDQRELDAARAAEAFLWRVRNRLHALAQRRSDRLTFDAQETLAVALGYVRAGADEDEERAVATERLMQDYYVHARSISRVRDRATSFATRKPGKAKKPKELGGGLSLAAGAVAIGDLAALDRDPSLALRAYAECVRLGAPIEDQARDAIARMTTQPEKCAALRASAEAASLFVELVSVVGEVPALGGSIARELHDTGLLLAMIPEFLPVTGRVHHDVYHVLTVDVHSVAAVDCLRDLARGELAGAHPLATRLAAEIARPRPLFLATLLHDIGKGYPGSGGSRKNHSVTGADVCDVVLPRLGFTAEETADVRALVLNHLAMYHLATRRDLDDAGTIDELCRVVRGREGLRDLYLLTVADITTTSPAAMTSWKAHMLEELYLRADARLAGAPASIDAERVEAVRAEVVRHGGDEAAAFVASMPMRYLLATPPSSIAAHAKLAASRADRPACVGLGPAHPSRADSEVCVVAKDRPGLLARIAAALAASRLDVSAAHISTREHAGVREAVDVFFVRDAGGDPAAVARKLAQVERDLVELCDDRVSASELVASRVGERAPWASRRTPDVRTKVVFDERTSPHHTIIEVFAKDEPGLLFRLAHALEEADLSITLSKINTEGTKVADVFYVQELDGRKVEGKKRLEDIERRLIDAMG